MALMEIPATQMRMEVRFGKRLIDAGLIGAQRAATLQQQCDSFEIREERSRAATSPLRYFESIEVLLHRSAIQPATMPRR